MILISTIWHTGTHSLMAELGVKDPVRNLEWEQFHCTPQTLEKARSGLYEVHTTLRDPHHVAISWHTRGNIHPEEGHHLKNSWFQQWDIWAEICEMAEVHDIRNFTYKENSQPDKSGLYEAYKKGDWDLYFRHIPRKFVEYATNLTREVHGAQFGVPYT